MANTTRILTIVLTLLGVISTELSQGQERASGVVVDAKSLKPIGGVAIHMEGGTTSISDSIGRFYSPKTMGKPVTLHFNHIAYQPQTLTNITLGDSSRTFYLQPREYTLSEIAIKGATVEKKGSNISVSAIDIQRAIPIMGESNINLLLQQKAGVMHAQEINPGLYVRGLSSSQNCVLLNGVPLFNVNHVLGIFPSINASIIGKTELLNDDVHPKYGNFLSSCLVMEGRCQLADSNELTMGIGGLTSHIYNRTPIVKEKLSFLIAARRSYFDLISNYYNKQNSSNSNRLPNYRLYDINSSIVFQPTKSDKIVLTAYYSNDKFGQKGPYVSMSWRWGNHVINVGWEKHLSEKFSFRLSGNGSHYRTITDLYKVEKSQIENYISRYQYTLDGTYRINKNIQFDAGLFLAQVETSIRNESKMFNGDESVLESMAGEYNNKGGYIAGDLKLSKYLQVKGGLRMEKYDHSSIFISPRIYAQSAITPSLIVFGAFSHRQQYDHLYSPMGVNLPIDMIIPSSKEIKPQKSHHHSLGVKVRFKKQLQLLASVYYSKLRNQVDFINPEPLYEGFYHTIGQGTSKGAELTISYKSKRLSTETSYSLSESLRQFDQINEGRWFHPPFDVTHKFDFSANLQLSRRLNLTISQFVQSGNMITIPTSVYYNQTREQLVPVYTSRYNLRLPFAHRLDMSLQYSVIKRYGSFRYSIGAYNVYNQANPYFIYFELNRLEDGQTYFTTKKRSMLPMVPFFMIECRL